MRAPSSSSPNPQVMQALRRSAIPVLASVLMVSASATAGTPDLVETDISGLQHALATGNTTSRAVVTQYLDRIERYDKSGPKLNALIALNPLALEEAQLLDAERARSGPRSPLHGIPLIVKDNFDTKDMPTTAGCLCLKDHRPASDATMISLLRDAGAIILGKSNLDEFAANIMSVSSLGGTTLNPYDTTRIPGGSSGGTAAAIAANLGVAGLGTDTSGSIRIPASFNSLVGVRPTVGLLSRTGIVPLAATQDTGGPMTRTVRDAAIMLDVLAKHDGKDVATAFAPAKRTLSYTDVLTADALKGARIGILGGMWDDKTDAADPQLKVFTEAVHDLKRLGADVVPVTLSNLGDILSYASSSRFEFKFLLNEYLARPAQGEHVKSLADILASGAYNAPSKSTYERAQARDSLTAPDYEHILLTRTRMVRDAIMRAMADHQLDALVYPPTRKGPVLIGQEQEFNKNSMLSSFSGYPAVTVPAGFTEAGLPMGIEFLGRPFSESLLLSLAYSYEQGTLKRRPPTHFQ